MKRIKIAIHINIPIFMAGNIFHCHCFKVEVVGNWRLFDFATIFNYLKISPFSDKIEDGMKSSGTVGSPQVT